VLVILHSGTRANRVAVFPDGMRVEVLGAVRGTNTFTIEKLWQRLARKVLPARFQTNIPSPVIPFANTYTPWWHAPLGGIYSGPVYTDSLTVVVYVRLAQPINRTAKPFAYPLSRPELLADDGVRPGEISMEWYGSMVPSTNPIREIYTPVWFSNAPSQQKEFTLRFFDQNNGDSATVRVPAPP